MSFLNIFGLWNLIFINQEAANRASVSFSSCVFISYGKIGLGLNPYVLKCFLVQEGCIPDRTGPSIRKGVLCTSFSGGRNVRDKTWYRHPPKVIVQGVFWMTSKM